MCGIVGYIGPLATKNLIENLKLLEYRGYDSAGIAEIYHNKIFVKKQSGKIDNLKKSLKNSSFPNSLCGIAHTRWATHGEPSDKNSHPHLSMKNTWAVVHNGIIENFKIFKDKLIKKGYVFKSDTDTEVISNLLEDLSSSDPLEALINCCEKLSGSYALVTIHKDFEKTLFLAKNKSPLYIANFNNQTLVSSDPICFAGKANKYFSLDDHEYCIAKQNEILFFDNKNHQIKKEALTMPDIKFANNKSNYPYYMLKEINETPYAIQNIINVYRDKTILNFIDEKFLQKFNSICLIGCGTAYHACLIGEKYFQKYTHFKTHSYMASEFKYSKTNFDKSTLFILVSQSGETADTISVNQLLRGKNYTTIAITNVAYSTLAQLSTFTLPTCAGIEVAVASTKAYCAQIAILYILARHFKNILNHKNQNFLIQLNKLAKKLKPFNLDTLNNLLENILQSKNVIFIGRNFDYVTGLEACLKLKEITYINTNAYPAGELKHGYLAAVDKDSLVFVIATNKNLIGKTLTSAYEVLSRGAKVEVTSQHRIEISSKLPQIHLTVLPSFQEDLMPIVAISFYQMLAYSVCIKKKLNPDQPRNLAKSVTVE